MVLLAYMVTAVVSMTLFEETDIGANILLINPIETAYEFGARLCNSPPVVSEYGEISTSLVTLGFFGWFLSSCLILFSAYQKREAI